MQLGYTGDGGGVDYPAPRAKGPERRGRGKPPECTAQIFADLKATSMHMVGVGWGEEVCTLV